MSYSSEIKKNKIFIASDVFDYNTMKVEAPYRDIIFNKLEELKSELLLFEDCYSLIKISYYSKLDHFRILDIQTEYEWNKVKLTILLRGIGIT